MRLVTSKNRAIQKYLETLSGYSISVQFQDRSTKRTAILSKTRSNAVISTPHCLLIDKAKCMKTNFQLYQRESVTRCGVQR